MDRKKAEELANFRYRFISPHRSGDFLFRRSFKYSVIPSFPVVAAIPAITVKNIQVTRSNDLMVFLGAD